MENNKFIICKKFPPASMTRCSLMILALIALMVKTYGQTHKVSDHMIQNDTTRPKAEKETFQEIGFFGEVKSEQWNVFVKAVQNNIRHSRNEKGNIAFAMYQPENGSRQPIWFERFKSKRDHNLHKEQEHFKKAISVIQRSLMGEAKSITLKVLEDLPAAIPVIAKQTKTSRWVVVLFDVIPERRKAFIGAMAGVAPLSRKAEGNLEFNLYGYAEDPNKFVLVEGWQSPADHEVQLESEYLKKLSADLEELFVSNPKSSRWVLKDISQ